MAVRRTPGVLVILLGLWLVGNSNCFLQKKFKKLKPPALNDSVRGVVDSAVKTVSLTDIPAVLPSGANVSVGLNVSTYRTLETLNGVSGNSSVVDTAGDDLHNANFTHENLLNDTDLNDTDLLNDFELFNPPPFNESELLVTEFATLPLHTELATAKFELQTFVVQCFGCLPPFEGGANLYRGMAVWNNFMCGNSVCNNSLNDRLCGVIFCDKCHCDSECTRYGDCCPDSFMESPPQQPDAQFTCVSQAFINPKIGHKKYKMVVNCREAAYEPDIDNCLNPDPESLEQNLPVYSNQTGLHYRNAQCARCNGLFDWTEWEINPFCEGYVDFTQVTSHSDLLQLLRREETCALHYYWPSGTDLRECYYPGKVIRSCNETGQWAEYNSDMERACRLFSQTVLFGTDMYNNIFCAACNNMNIDSHYFESCIHEIGRDDVVPLSVLLNVRSAVVPAAAESRTTSCQPNEVFDTYNNICRPFLCPRGAFAENHDCVHLFKSAKGLAYIIHFELTPRDDVSARRISDVTYQIYRLIEENLLILIPKRTKADFKVTFLAHNQSDLMDVYKVDVQVATLVNALVPREVAESRLAALLSREWFYYPPGAVTPVYFDFTWLPDLDNERLRPSQFWFDINPEPVEFLRVAEIGYDTNTFQQLPSEYFENTTSYIQVSKLMMCRIIELKDTEYTVLGPREVVIKHTQRTLPEGEFLWSGAGIKICTNFTAQRPATATNTSGSLDFDQTEVTLTLVCTSLSLCGLAVTLVIYCVVPSLKTLPGKNNILLFTNLFLAQLLFLTGPRARGSLPACRALGVLIHYFWLATFCWKLVCAFHMHRMFTNPFKALNVPKTFLKYVAFSQLVPGLVITAIVSANIGLSGGETVGYADRPNLCFLSGALDVGLGFLAPVGIIVILNSVFFSRVVYVLRNRPKVQRHTSKSDVKESVVYFKMSLILGFTWLLGFVAVIVDDQGMWYVFTVVNASLGVFVFVGFGMKNLSVRTLFPGRYKTQLSSLTSKTHETSDGISKWESQLHGLGESGFNSPAKHHGTK